jgi:hypothetical protein
MMSAEGSQAEGERGVGRTLLTNGSRAPMSTQDRLAAIYLFESFVALLSQQQPHVFEFQEFFLFVLFDAMSMIETKKKGNGG